MSGLPRALAPWAALLAPLTDDLQLALGGWARRIAAALGPLEAPHAAAGEPDGVSGIARRGPYERLLLSEWLLAREAPEEFTRRAAMGEHLFLARGRRSPGAGRAVVALVDAGPEQLGAPRIAQLAVLVVLAARAEGAGVGFSWGVLQDPAGGLHQGLGEAEVRRFLAARTRSPALAEHAQAWAEAMDAAGADAWLIGGPAAQALLPGSRARVVVEEVPSPAERTVTVEVRRPRVAARELRLPLPPEPDCVRLLRNPFAPPPAAPHAAQTAVQGGSILAAAGILFAPSGRRAALRLEGGTLVDVHVPAAPGERIRRPRRRPTGPALVAFGGWGSKGQHAMVEVAPDAAKTPGIRVRGTWGAWTARMIDGAALPAPPARDAPLAACHRWPRAGAVARYWFLDGRRTLHVCAEGGRASVAAAEVVAIVSGDDLSFLAVRGGQAELEVHHAPATASPSRRTGPPGGTTRIPLGPTTGRGYLALRGSSIVGAVEIAAGGPWAVFRMGNPSLADHSHRRFHPLPGMEVVGVIAHEENPALLVLEGGGTRFTALGRLGVIPVHEEPRGVGVAAVDPTGATLGYVTRTGEAVFHDLRKKARLLECRFDAGAEPDRAAPTPTAIASLPGRPT